MIIKKIFTTKTPKKIPVEKLLNEFLEQEGLDPSCIINTSYSRTYGTNESLVIFYIEKKKLEEDIFSMTYDELMEYYILGLIEKADGVRDNAASLADVPKGTFKSRYRKFVLKKGKL